MHNVHSAARLSKFCPPPSPTTFRGNFLEQTIAKSRNKTGGKTQTLLQRFNHIIGKLIKNFFNCNKNNFYYFHQMFIKQCSGLASTKNLFGQTVNRKPENDSTEFPILFDKLGVGNCPSCPPTSYAPAIFILFPL